MYRVSSVTIAILFTCLVLQAQVDKVYTGSPVEKQVRQHKQLLSDEVMDKLLWGGNFQAWFGNPTFIFLAPTVGYSVTEQLQMGLGVIYNYTSYRTLGGRFSQSIFGGHSYARYLIGDGFFGQLQFDKLYQPDWYSTDPAARRWVNYLLLGAGFRQPMGDNAALMTSIMYNLTPDPLSIYPNRIIIQFGFVSGF